MFDDYTLSTKFKDVRGGQTFMADEFLYLKLVTAQGNYNARRISDKRYATFQPDDIVAVYGKKLKHAGSIV